MLAAVCGVVLASLGGGPTPASDLGPVADPALVAAARHEGTLSIYSSLGQAQLAAVAAQFEATYGIHTDILRIESDKLPGRILTEARAGHFAADIVGTTGFQADQLKRAGLFATFRPPEARALVAGTVDPDGTWAAVILNTATICYNPARLKADGLTPPRTWEDLAAPAWRGKFALFSGSYEWYVALQHYYGKEKADALVRAYAANAPRMLGSHQLGINLTEAGDVDAAANVYGYDVVAEHDRGQSIALVNPIPVVVEIYSVSVTRTAAHPAAAQLFERWWLSHDGQVWSRQSLHRISPRKDVQNDPTLYGAGIRFQISNPAESTVYGEAVRAFNDIFGIPN